MRGIFEKDYRQAQIRTVLYRNGDEKHLIFATIELCPNELSLPKETPASQVIIQGSRNRIFELNVFQEQSVWDAIEWYHSGKNGLLPRYIEFQKIDFLTEPPNFPNLSFSTSKCSFSPTWAGSTRISRKIPKEELGTAISTLLDEIATVKSTPQEKRSVTQKNISEAHSRLIEFCGFDPFTFVDFLQNKVLVAPNPIFRNLFWKPIKDDNGKEIDIFVSIEPRDCIEFPVLEVRLLEHRNETITNAYVQRLSKETSWFVWRVGREAHQISWEIICPIRGLLSKSEPHGVIRKSTIRINPIVQSVKFDIPRGGKRKLGTTETTHVHGRPIVSEVGGSADPTSPLPKLLNRQTQRDILLQENLNKQHVFHENPDLAKSTVRSLISSAQKELIIIDPYFGYRELGIYGYANGQYGVVAKILTSAEFLKNDHLNFGGEILNGLETEGPWMQVFPRVKNGEVLMKTQDKSPIDVAIKVMRGQKPAIHDRFLIIDDNVWLLGPSLNELGERLGVLVALPNPKAIKLKLYEIWDQCPSLVEWVDEQ